MMKLIDCKCQNASKLSVCLVRITVLIEPLLKLRYVIRKEKRNEP